MSIIEDFASLFQGRNDAYGLEEGGCGRNVNEDPHEGWIECHLTGQDTPLGVYPLVPDNYVSGFQPWIVKFGCIDLDVKGEAHTTGYESAADAYTAACNLRAALGSFGITGWVEITRSGGFHLWVFASTWVPAKTMRHALLVACEIAGVPPTEVNPKSTGEGQPPEFLSNYVRLPYPGALSAHTWDGTRRHALDADGDPLSLAQFVADALECLTTEAQLAEMADLYVEPVQQESIEFEGDSPELTATLRKLSGLAWTICNNPPLEGQDRSSRLFKLAIECKSSGLTPDEAVAVLLHADQLHGRKYAGRRDCMDRIRTTIERAYRKAATQ